MELYNPVTIASGKMWQVFISLNSECRHIYKEVKEDMITKYSEGAITRKCIDKTRLDNSFHENGECIIASSNIHNVGADRSRDQNRINAIDYSIISINVHKAIGNKNVRFPIDARRVEVDGNVLAIESGSSQTISKIG